MKRTFLYLSVVTALLIAACQSSDNKKQPAVTDNDEDSVIVVGEDTAFSVETIDTFNTLAFSSFAKKRAPDFDWSKFRMTGSWKADSLRTTSFKPSAGFFAAYGKLIKYSPDSAFFIDLDSYSLEVKKNATGRWRGTDLGTDTEISLVNPATQTKERLLFFGPGSSVDDAYWLDKNNLVLIGVQDNGDSTGKAAALWKYNVPEKTFYLYEWKDEAAANKLIHTWRRERLQAALQ